MEESDQPQNTEDKQQDTQNNETNPQTPTETLTDAKSITVLDDSGPGASSQAIDNILQDPVLDVDNEAVEKLTFGVLSSFLPGLQKSKSILSEVTENQRILIETLQQENAKFAESDALQEVINMMFKAKVYHGKLQSIRKDMVMLHEKSAKLKKRALRLQQQKHKEILQLEQARERELDREQQLVAKLSSDKR